MPSQPLRAKSFSFTISSKKQKVTFYNCQIGEVYLLTGGANVKLPLNETFNKNTYSEDMDIRFLNLDDEEVRNQNSSSWKLFGKADFDKQGALGYLFSSYLYENIGLDSQ